MNTIKNVIGRHETFFEEARRSHDLAIDGPKKLSAALQLDLADTAALSGNEVNYLLAIHRALQALE